MNEKTIALFIKELLLITFGEDVLVYEQFAGYINSFIYQYRHEYYDSFSLLFDMDLLNEYLEEEYEVLSFPAILGLLKKYGTDEKYIELIEEIGPKDGDKINDLAIAFAMYIGELQELAERKPNGPFKILH